MNFQLPLMHIGGRGRAGYTMTLAIERQWQVRTIAVPTCNQSGCTYYESNYRYTAYPSTWNSIRPGFGPGVLLGRQSGSGAGYLAQGCSTPIYSYTLTRLTFIGPDGTEMELRDRQTGGQPIQGGGAVGCYGGLSRGKVFVTADGSSATFVSDAEIFDDKQPRQDNVFYPSGYLMFRDGTRYRVVNGLITSIRDTNGNQVTFTYSGNQVSGIDDSMNRHISVNGDISFKGAGGNTRTIKFYSASLSSVLRKHPDGSTEYTIKTYPELFGLPNSEYYQSGAFDIPVTSAVELPDGRQYQFRYDSYANLAQVILPTGGRIEYDWATDTYMFDNHVYGITTRLIERRTAVNTTTSSYETKTIYPYPAAGYGGPTVITVDNVDPRNGDALISRSKHYFYGGFVSYPEDRLYPRWQDGREYQTELFAADGTTVLRRINYTFQQKAAVSWWTGTADQAPPNDPRLVETTTTLVDTNQVSKSSAINPITGAVGFDQYNNQTDVWEYDYGSGTPGTLLRHTATSFLTSGYDTLLPNASSPNLSLTYHIRNLPAQVFIYDGGGTERARTTFEYDNYTTDSFHAGLVDRSDISGHDSAVSTNYLTRGNMTAMSKYLLPAGTPITGYGQFDIAGNIVKVIDPRSTPGNVISTSIFYQDNFGAPDGSLAERFTFAELGSQQTYAFPTEVRNALNQSGFTQYDYYLGQGINAQDLNGIVAAGYHIDSLDRLTQIRRAFGTAAENQTTYEYDDAGHAIYTRSDLNDFNDKILVSGVFYDGLGRTIETRRYEGGTNSIASQTQYDGAGRANKTSNPFRDGTPVWTTTTYDSLSRVLTVTTPDNAVVTTNYSGNTVTVTDQAGKLRRSLTDALGRLTRVDEPNSSNSLGDVSNPNQPTSYSYDVLDNLVQVTQGSQQRFFMYDSLKRLIRARNPEQDNLSGLILSDPITGNGNWSYGYQYDSAGNLIQKTDARNIVSTYGYDALNRNTSVNHSNTTIGNPDVPDITRFYDGATNGIGRFWYSYKAGNLTVGNNVEHTAIDSYDALGRPLVLRQMSKLNGTWSPPYQTTRAYNRAGAVTSQIYPSLHTVTYSYDSAGRTSSFNGNLGDGTNRTYSTGISYSPFGGLAREQFGTDTLLYHKTAYNVRGQLFDTRLSTVSWTTDPWNWNRGAIVNYYSANYAWEGDPATPAGPDNNGNVLRQQHWIPADDSISSYNYTQATYTYDSLNRIQSAVEVHGTPASQSPQDYAQVFTYDRFGNRTINGAQTWGVGINNKQFEPNVGNKNQLGVPSGQTGTMSYDAAGNLINDTYTGAGSREYDAENKMTKAWGGNNQWQEYTYNADGQRVRRKVDGQETWLIFGLEGELLAEYAANGPAASPQKEYGYRNGELLITADGRTNVALAANGGVASASTAHTCCGFSVGGAINGNIRGPWGSGEGWNDATPNELPDWFQVDFAGSKTIDEIDVFSLHDDYTHENTPTETQTFSLYGLVNFEVQYWNGSSWATIPAGSVSNNNKVWRKFTFAPLTTNKIRVWITGVPDAWSRLVELQAWEAAVGAPNLALNKPTSQSSEGWGGVSSRAVDGNTSGNWNDNSVTHTLYDNQPWWQVDLGASYSINIVELWNRTDCCGERLANFNVILLDANQSVVNSVNYPGQVGTSTTITVSGTARYVKVQLIGTNYLSLAEVKVWGTTGSASSKVHWLVKDHLGTPRIIVDQTGALASVKRHDYLPFGEELFAPTGGRTAVQGYAGGDGVRQQFTRKERDIETGLDYFEARYYSSLQGRFTSPDEFSGGPHDLYVLGSGDGEKQALVYADVTNPQSLNKYSYCFDNPLRYVDPDGHDGLTLDSPMVQRMIQGAAIGVGPTLTADGIHRGRYEQAAKEASKTVRNMLKADTRDNMSTFSREVSKLQDASRVGQEVRHTAESARRTSPLWNKVGKGARILGPAATGVAVVFSVSNVVNAEPGHRLEATAVEVGAWAGASAGAAGGAKLGGIIGTAIEPGIGTAIGIAAGSIVGGAGGAVVGSKIVEKAINTPLPPVKNRTIEPWQH